MLIFTLSFMTLSNTAIASEHGGGGGANHGQLTEEEKRLKKLEIVDNIEKYLLFLCSQIGAYFNGSSYSDFYKNYVDYVKSTNDKWFEDNVSVSDDGKAVFSQDLMQSLKEYLDKYAKEENSKEENGGFYLLPTTPISEVPVDRFLNAQQMRTFRNIVIEKGCLVVRVRYGAPIRFVDPFSDPNHPIFLIGDLSNLNSLKEYPYMPVSSSFFCVNDWKTHSYRVQTFPEQDKIYTSCSDGIDYETGINSNLYCESGYMNWDFANHGSLSENFTLYSTTGEYIRVFVSQNAAKNYSVGKRSVYYTEKYYNYVPEDLSVSVDDLQKSVDDLQKVIDELLKQIGDNTSEKEIMDLLKQILEELHNQQGGGGGSGGGDVTVDIDLSTTNGLLSKILAKVTQIFDKMSSSAGQTMDSVVTAIEDLGKMLKKYLKAITGDLDDIKDKLDVISEQEFSEKTGSFMEEAKDSFSDVTDVAKTKFPFCVPNDFYNLLSKMSEGPPATGDPETGAAVQTMDVYVSTGEMISVMSGHTESRAQLSDTGAPVFHMPIVLERYGIDYTMVVDLSPFQSVANISRTFFVLIFIHGLLLLTIKIVDLWSVMTQ